MLHKIICITLYICIQTSLYASDIHGQIDSKLLPHSEPSDRSGITCILTITRFAQFCFQEFEATLNATTETQSVFSEQIQTQPSEQLLTQQTTQEHKYNSIISPKETIFHARTTVSDQKQPLHTSSSTHTSGYDLCEINDTLCELNDTSQ